MTIKIYPRCFLNTPAFQTEWFNKASEFGAEVGIIDLEDAIPKNKKEEARKYVNFFLNKKNPFLTGIRINSIRSSEGIKDILLLLNISHAPDIIILPEIESAEEVKIVSDLLTTNNFQPQIFSVIESPKGLLNIKAIAKVSDGLIFGAADYSAELGIEITNECTMIARHIVATAAAAFDIPAIDTPTFDVNNTKKLIEECEYAKKIGFKGKIAIHTSQVQIINKIFSPTHEQIQWAQNILSTLEQAEKSIAKLNGIMIGPPFIKMAQRILAMNNGMKNV